MLQVYLVRHGETQWNAERRIQGQSDSPLTAKGEQQAMQVATRAKELGITHIISSDLGRTRRTAEIIAQACGCDIIFDSRLRELNMGVLEKRHIDSLTEEEENQVVLKEIKQLKETIEMTPENRADLLEEAYKRLAVLEEYAPKMMSEDEIKAVISEVLAELGIEKPAAKDKGRIMKVLMPKVKGKADGKLVNDLLAGFMQ